MKRAEITAPPSKSVSHRTLICAALANGVSRLENLLDSVDLKITRQCLEAGGVGIQGEASAPTVTGRPGGLGGGPENGDPVELYMHESGTSCRLLTAVAAAGRGLFRISGAPRLHDRPIGALAQALSPLGARIDFEEKAGYPPLRLATEGLFGGTVEVSIEESSQYLSGILLAAPLCHTALVVSIGGKKVVSWPYVALTLQAMEDFGADVRVQKRSDEKFLDADWRKIERAEPGQVRFVVQPGWYSPRNAFVEGDWSGASYFLAAGAAGPAEVRVAGLREDSVQGDRAMAEIITRMGADVFFGDGAVTVGPSRLSGIDVDMGHCPDLVPTVAALASFAKGVTTITNVAHLRIKESDRLAAMAENLAKTGCRAEVFEDGMSIDPAGRADSGRIEVKTYGDHRIAMAMSLLELAGFEVVPDDPGCTAKSFPDFFDKWGAVREAAS